MQGGAGGGARPRSRLLPGRETRPPDLLQLTPDLHQQEEEVEEEEEDGDITPKAAGGGLDSVRELDESGEAGQAVQGAGRGTEDQTGCWSSFSWSSLYDRGTDSSLSWADDVSCPPLTFICTNSSLPGVREGDD